MSDERSTTDVAKGLPGAMTGDQTKPTAGSTGSQSGNITLTPGQIQTMIKYMVDDFGKNIKASASNYLNYSNYDLGNVEGFDVHKPFMQAMVELMAKKTGSLAAQYRSMGIRSLHGDTAATQAMTTTLDNLHTSMKSAGSLISSQFVLNNKGLFGEDAIASARGLINSTWGRYGKAEGIYQIGTGMQGMFNAYANLITGDISQLSTMGGLTSGGTGGGKSSSSTVSEKNPEELLSFISSGIEDKAKALREAGMEDKADALLAKYNTVAMNYYNDLQTYQTERETIGGK